MITSDLWLHANQGFSTTVGKEFFNIVDIYFLYRNDELLRKATEFLKDIDFIIYNGATPEQIKRWERIRDQDQCIAINFDALNVTPEECLNSLDYIKTMPLADLLEEDKKERIKKVMLVEQAWKTQSCFFNLPKDVVIEINIIQYLLQPKYIFVKLPLIPQRYVAEHSQWKVRCQIF